MSTQTPFPLILIVVGVAATVLLVNTRAPLNDPINRQPPPTSTVWAAPVLNTLTVAPTLLGDGGGWFSNLPTAIPVTPRVVSTKLPTSTLTVTPK